MPETIPDVETIRLVPEHVDRSLSSHHFVVEVRVPPSGRATYLRRIIQDSSGQQHGMYYCIGYTVGHRRHLHAVDPALGGVLLIDETFNDGKWRVLSRCRE